MAKRIFQLTAAATQHIKGNSQLWKDISDLLGIMPSSLQSFLTRNSPKLIQQPVITIIAKSMCVAPETLVEEKKIVKKQSVPA